MSTLHELIKYGSFLGGSGGSSGGDWEVLADMEFAVATGYVEITEFPDGGSIRDVKRLYVTGSVARDSDGNGGGDLVLRCAGPDDVGGIQICGGQSTVGAIEFSAFIERVGNELCPFNIMSSHSNYYWPLVYKTNYVDVKGTATPLGDKLHFGQWTAGSTFGVGSRLKVWAIRNK